MIEGKLGITSGTSKNMTGYLIDSEKWEYEDDHLEVKRAIDGWD